MNMKKSLIKRIFMLFIGGFFMLINLFGLTSPNPVSAIENPTTTTTTTETVAVPKTDDNGEIEVTVEDLCSEDLGNLSWRICPETDKASQAADWLYEKIEQVLVVNPIAAEDGSPIYEVWKYCRGVTNIVFIIFLLIVIYSQITGMGISNYGLKKALPKLIIAAVLVNLSFIICALAVDVSNIIGSNLRELFIGIEQSATSGENLANLSVSYSDYFNALSGKYTELAGGVGAGLVAGLIAVESGTIWMLIPTVLASLIAVVIGLITVAMRQAVIVLLVMISPVAIVASILPNTEEYFKKWKKLFIKMLVFYPMMSLLFGASNLAGWAIINSSQDGFVILLGKAVQFFPLFFSWSLMKMSDTILGKVSGKLTSWASPLIASNRAWADSHRALTRERNLARNIYTPSARLNRFLTNHRIAREEDTEEYRAHSKLLGQAYNVRRQYTRIRGPRNEIIETLSREGEETYDMQQRNMAITALLDKHKVNFEEGFSDDIKHIKDRRKYRRILDLDKKNVDAADAIAIQKARAATVDLNNARGRFERFQDAVDANTDDKNVDTEGYQKHILNGDREVARNRYQQMLAEFKGREREVKYAASEASSAYDANRKVYEGKFQKNYEMTVPTQNIVSRLKELTSDKDLNANIDAIIAAMRVLNARGDTSLVREAINDICKDDKLELGTHASQSLASFLLFELKGNSPVLRRFGKYLNLETAKAFNNGPEEKRRHNRVVTYNEYINGSYIDSEYEDEMGVVHAPRVKYPKRGSSVLLNGTSYRDVEREGYDDNEKSAIEASKNAAGKINLQHYMKKSDEIFKAILPNIVGDHQTYLSGGEQIISAGHYVADERPLEQNGQIVKDVNGDPVYQEMLPDFLKNEAAYNEMVETNGVTYKEALKQYRDFKFKRSTKFIGSQVPTQISHTKTDMLYAQLAQFADYSYYNDVDDPEVGEEEANRRKASGYYKEMAKDIWKGAIDKDVLKMVARSSNRGYQSESKASLFRTLRWSGEEGEAVMRHDAGYPLVAASQSNDTRSTQPSRDIAAEDDDDYGGPELDQDFGFQLDDTSNSEMELAIRKIFSSHRDGRHAGDAQAEIQAAYQGVLDYISDPLVPLTDMQKAELQSLGGTLSFYTSVAEFKEAVNRIIHG